MPYFKWRGVNLVGKIKKGKLFAPSQEHLDNLLFKRDIALLSCSKAGCYFTKPITFETKIQFFRQLASLVRSGLLVHDALHIISQQIGNIRFQEIALMLSQETKKGEPLHKVLEKYPYVFDDVTVKMFAVAQQAGSVAEVSESLADHMYAQEQFRKQLRSGAMMPFITFVFFIFVLLVIFIGVIPRFADIFAASDKPLPPITQIMIRISHFLRSWYAVTFAGLVLVLFIGIRKIAHKSGMLLFDKIIIQLPLFARLKKQKALAYFSHALSLLLSSGMQLVPALAIAKKAVSNSVLQGNLTLLESEVAAGSSLSDAMARQQEWFGQESIAMILVGETSGTVSTMLKNIAHVNEKKVQQTLLFITKIFQPLLMIVLGLLVTALLFSVYLPIFNLSEVIGFN